MTNGVMHTGTIEVGDVDVWNFPATNGESMIVAMGKIVAASTLTPILSLYGPDGRPLDSFLGAAAAQVSFRATNSGTFTIVASDHSGGFSGNGTYRLTLAKTGNPVVVSPDDEGGPLNGSDSYDGAIAVGDLDVFYFTACAGDDILLRIDELVSGSSLTPWLRLYGRDGTLFRSLFGTATAQFSVRATNNGTFLVVAGDFSGGFEGSGAYRLTVNGLSAGLKLCNPHVTGANVTVGGIGGTPGETFILYTHTNITTPFGLWTPILTNPFAQFGVFNYTNAFNRAEPERYFRLQVP